MFYHADWSRCRIEGREIRGENPRKTLEKLGCEKYVTAKIMRVNTAFAYEQLYKNGKALKP
jgi:hypothetical protein